MKWTRISAALLGFLLTGGVLSSGYASPACRVESPACVDGRLLHVPSPDWRDQIIYFLMIDRFNDGDPARNDLGYSLYRPDEEGGFSGGDLQGVIDKLDYLEALGATAIWTTPPVASQWWMSAQNYGGYHGYWPRDFSKIDEHYGTLDTYKALSHELHRRNMYLIMDIVVNHVGNYFEFSGAYDPKNPAAGYRAAGNDKPTAAPTMAPFDMNNPNNPEHRAAGIYHWTPFLSDFEDRNQELTYQLGNLDDLNTMNPAVQAAFKNVYGYWIEEAGLDAFRIDTVKYVEPEFFTDFLHGAGGVYETARKTGRDNFLVFGEVKVNAPAFSEESENKMRAYISDARRPAFNSLINFPLQEDMVRVLAGGTPTSALTYRLNKFANLFPDPTIAPNFVDNHDVPRFATQGSDAAFRQALAMLFAVPGIPVIYQGDEQGLTDSRQAMFAGGYLSPDDRFDQDSGMFNYIRTLVNLRKAHPALRRGDMEILADNPTAPGVFAFKRHVEGETIFVILNTADHPTLLARMPTRLPEGVILKPVFGGATAQTVGRDGRLTMELAPRSAIFFVSSGPEGGEAMEGEAPRAYQRGEIVVLTAAAKRPVMEDVLISGAYHGPDKTLLFVQDGNLAAAEPVPVNDDGGWSVRLTADDLGTHERFFQIYAPLANSVSERIFYTTTKQIPDWEMSATDAEGDDRGPDGTYRMPQSPGFDGQQDILGVSLRGGGDVLQLELKMRKVTNGWLPINGFDHASFAIFFDFPGDEGERWFDELNAPMPDDFGWSYAHLLFGWGNSLLKRPSQTLSAAPDIAVDRDRQTITITYRASMMGQEDWRDSRIYVTTWDRSGEGGVRTITREGAEFEYGGEPGGAKVLDDVLLDLSAGTVRRK